VSTKTGQLQHPNQIGQWRRRSLAGVRELFGDQRQRQGQDGEAQKTRLYEEIGRLKVELDWLKEKDALFGH